MENTELRLNEILKEFVCQPLSDHTLPEIKHKMDCEIRKSVDENNLIDFPEFIIPTDAKRFIGNATISISPKNLYSAIWAFGKELPPPKDWLMDAMEWISERTNIRYFVEDGVFKMEYRIKL